MPINGRRKGADWELEVAKVLGKWWGATFRRTPLSGGWAKGGKDGKGVMRGDLVQMDGPAFPFSVECKASERWSLEAFMKARNHSELTKFLQQAWAGAFDEGKVPLLIAKRNNVLPVAFMPVEQFGRPLVPFTPDGKPYFSIFTFSFTDRTGVDRWVCMLLLRDLVTIAPTEFAPPPNKVKTARRVKKP